VSEGEFEELIDFLGRRFEAIDGRFEAIDGRFEALEARLARVEVLGEDTRVQVRTVAEGLTAFREQTDGRFGAVEGEFAAVRAEMAQGFAAVHRAIGDLALRVDRLDRAS
jgi:hypothetical protein